MLRARINEIGNVCDRLPFSMFPHCEANGTSTVNAYECVRPPWLCLKITMYTNYLERTGHILLTELIVAGFSRPFRDDYVPDTPFTIICVAAC